MLLKNAVTAMAVCFMYPNAPAISEYGSAGLKNRSGNSPALGDMSKDGFCIWNSTSDYQVLVNYLNDFLIQHYHILI